MTTFLHNLSSLEDRKQVDKQREALCLQQGNLILLRFLCTGITLIPIPFWWDKKISSLTATIHQYRPELVSDPKANAIPAIQPSERQLKSQEGINKNK